MLGEEPIDLSDLGSQDQVMETAELSIIETARQHVRFWPGLRAIWSDAALAGVGLMGISDDGDDEASSMSFTS